MKHFYSYVHMSIGNNLLNTYLTHISNYPAETLEIEVQ